MARALPLPRPAACAARLGAAAALPFRLAASGAGILIVATLAFGAVAVFGLALLAQRR